MLLRSPTAFLLLVIAAAGCNHSTAEPHEAAGPLANAGSQFDPTRCGAIQGSVHWSGPVPKVEPFVIPPIALGMDSQHGKMVWPNPNAPRIDESNRGVGNAVVYLRGIDPVQARPWHHPPVTVELADYQIRIQQGQAIEQYGFVRRGEAIEMVSRQQVHHGLHADGASFFTLAFPDPHQQLQRRLERNGVVELSSSMTYFWARGHLFVDDHPYYARTERAGSFMLNEVPAGTYELVCWLPSWRQAGRHLDPELGNVLRHYFQPPVEIEQRVQVRADEQAKVDFEVGLQNFVR